MAIMTRIKLARRYGVQPHTIDKYVAAGMPYVTEANRDKGQAWEFDTDETDDWLKEYEEAEQARTILELQQQETVTEEDERIKQARIKKLQVETERLQLRLDRERGELIAIDSIADIVEAQYNAVRANLLALPHKLAPILAGKKDVQEIDDIITSYITETLEELREDELPVVEDEQVVTVKEESETEPS